VKLPKQLDLLERAGQHVVAGLNLHAEALGLPNSLRSSVESSLRDLAAADPQFDKPSPHFMHTIGPALAKANYLAGTAITRSKEVLRARFGEEWSQAWAEAGFAHSTQTPGTAPERIDLLAKLAAFFKAHPDCEVANSEVTAAQLSKRGAELQEAFHNSNEHSRAWSIGVSSRSLAGERLRAALQAILAELEKALPASDPRWSAFAMNAEPTTAPVTPIPARRGRPRKNPLPTTASPAPLTSPAPANPESAAEFQLWKYACQLAEKAKLQADQARETLARAEAGLQRLRTEAEQAMSLAKNLQTKADLLAPAGSKGGRKEGSRPTSFEMPLPG